MNNREVFLSDYRYKLKQARRVGERMMLTNMLYDNVKDLIPSCWKIEPSYCAGLRISPVDDKASMVDQFVKLNKKLAKTFRKEPYMIVEKDILNSTFYCRLNYNDKYKYKPLIIDIYVGNTEKCEIIETTVVEEVVHTELTGYCKMIKERKYYEESN